MHAAPYRGGDYSGGGARAMGAGGLWEGLEGCQGLLRFRGKSVRSPAPAQ